MFRALPWCLGDCRRWPGTSRRGGGPLAGQPDILLLWPEPKHVGPREVPPRPCLQGAAGRARGAVSQRARWRRGAFPPTASLPERKARWLGLRRCVFGGLLPRHCLWVSLLLRWAVYEGWCPPHLPAPKHKCQHRHVSRRNQEASSSLVDGGFPPASPVQITFSWLCRLQTCPLATVIPDAS